jgi:hypothetical protein
MAHLNNMNLKWLEAWLDMDEGMDGMIVCVFIQPPLTQFISIINIIISSPSAIIHFSRVTLEVRYSIIGSCGKINCRHLVDFKV